MAKVMLCGADIPENWRWDENPINGQEYDLEDIPTMYGSDFYKIWVDTDQFINSWVNENWDPSYGKWERKEASHV